jgi:uncharacterized protein
MSLRFNVSDLIGRAGTHREVAGELPLSLRLGETVVEDTAGFEARLQATSNAIMVKLEASAMAHVVCTRCLTEWDEPVEVDVTQPFTRVEDEDGYRIEHGDFIDLAPMVRDEVALALEAAPLCRQDCRGLCPTCGADLNTDPCAGHGEEHESPFSVLRQLLDPPT